MYARFAFCVSAVALFLAVPAASAQAVPTALDTVALAPDLDRVLRDYERAWRARDAAALAALFTPDGFILRPGHPPVRGRAAIEAAYRGSGGPLHLHAFTFARADTVAYIVGGYRGAPTLPDGGKFTLTLRRSPGGPWLIASDMDNGNR